MRFEQALELAIIEPEGVAAELVQLPLARRWNAKGPGTAVNASVHTRCVVEVHFHDPIEEVEEQWLHVCSPPTRG